MQLVLPTDPTQGPSWLASLIYKPPVWLRTVLPFVGFLFACLVAYRLWRDGPPDSSKQEQMGTILATALGVAAATITVTELDIGSYGLEVVVGTVVGFVVVTGGKEIGRYLLRRFIDADRRTACAWVSFTALLWMPAAIVPASSRITLLWSIIHWGMVISGGMALVTAHEEF